MKTRRPYCTKKRAWDKGPTHAFTAGQYQVLGMDLSIDTQN